MKTGFIVPDWPAPPGVHAFTTTRTGGVSKGKWHSLNLGDRCGDAASSVSENRRRLRESLPAEPRWLEQVHGARVVRHDGGAGAPAKADGIYGKAPGRICAVLTADCLPVLFCDRSGSTVAAAHAGWRGLAAGILENTVAAMGVNPEQLLAWLGPAIGPAAYEVGRDVRQAFDRGGQSAAAAFTPHGDRWLMDIYHVAKLRLTAVGLDRVHGGDFCTWSDTGRFFSYRRDGETGRMASVVWRD